MLKASAAALGALLAGCAGLSDAAREPRQAVAAPAIQLYAGDRITVKTTEVSQYVCVDESRLVCGYGNGRLSHVLCQCQRAAASPAFLR